MQKSNNTMLTRLLTYMGGRAEFSRFIIVGLINTGSTYLIFLLTLWSIDSPTIAYNIAFMSGLVISYCLNLKFTFREKHSVKKMLSFPLVYIVQYVVGFGVLKLALSFSIPAEVAGLLTIPATVPITFLMSRFLLR